MCKSKWWDFISLKTVCHFDIAVVAYSLPLCVCVCFAETSHTHTLAVAMEWRWNLFRLMHVSAWMKEKNFEELPISYFRTLFEMVALWIGYINGCVWAANETDFVHKNPSLSSEHRANKCALSLHYGWICWNKHPQKRGSRQNRNMGRVEKTLSAGNGNEKSDHHHIHTQSTMNTMMLYYKTLKSGNIFWSAPVSPRSVSFAVCECHSQSITIFVCNAKKPSSLNSHASTHYHRDVFMRNGRQWFNIWM